MAKIRYTCSHCKGEFISEQDEEEAHAEAVALWGRRGDTEDMSVVCEVCWQKMMKWYRKMKVH